MESVIKNYRDTLDLVAKESGGYDSSEKTDGQDKENGMQQENLRPPIDAKTRATIKEMNIRYSGTSIDFGSWEVETQEGAQKVIDAINALKIMLPDVEDEPADEGQSGDE